MKKVKVFAIGAAIFGAVMSAVLFGFTVSCGFQFMDILGTVLAGAVAVAGYLEAKEISEGE